MCMYTVCVTHTYTHAHIHTGSYKSIPKDTFLYTQIYACMTSQCSLLSSPP